MNSLRFKTRCTFKRVPDDATDPTERETVATVRCSNVYAPVSTVYGVSKQMQERGNWSQLAQGRVIYTEVPDVDIDTDMRLTVGGTEYRVRDITGWPDNSPEFFEIFIEAES